MRKEWLQLRFGNLNVALLFPSKSKTVKEKYIIQKVQQNLKYSHVNTMHLVQKAKGTADARKHASDTMRDFFRDPENRRKRSISMKGMFI